MTITLYQAVIALAVIAFALVEAFALGVFHERDKKRVKGKR